MYQCNTETKRVCGTIKKLDIRTKNVGLVFDKGNNYDITYWMRLKDGKAFDKHGVELKTGMTVVFDYKDETYEGHNGQVTSHKVDSAVEIYEEHKIKQTKTLDKDVSDDFKSGNEADDPHDKWFSKLGRFRGSIEADFPQIKDEQALAKLFACYQVEVK